MRVFFLNVASALERGISGLEKVTWITNKASNQMYLGASKLLGIVLLNSAYKVQ